MYAVYILTNYTNTTFYIGVTNDLQRRFLEHSNGLKKSFSSKYRLKKLVYFEQYKYIDQAIAREKQLKNWHRQWKINLIKQYNPLLQNLDAETSSA